MQRITVGVDAGKRTHQVAAYDPAAGTVVGQGSFPVSRVGFEQLALCLHQHASDEAAVLVGIEATGHYHVTLAEFLLERGSAVVLMSIAIRFSAKSMSFWAAETFDGLRLFAFRRAATSPRSTIP